MERQLEQLFASRNLRSTAARRKVFAVLHEQDEPVTASQVADKCDTIDRTSVYRSLDLFVAIGIAKQVPIGWKQRYELTNPFKAHHHHLSCVRCGQLVDLQSPAIERMIKSVAADYGFEAVDHTFEIRGICPDCKAS